jgi:hypothetical protein
MEKETSTTIEPASLERRICIIRGQKVIFDSDLADLYQVPAKRLNEQVKRNIERFPSDFMFRLSAEEVSNLRSQFATSSSGYGGRRYLPFVFTEHGVAMVSSVLRSPRAIQMNIFIVRAFVRIRDFLATNQDVSLKILELEQGQEIQDRAIIEISKVIDRLTEEAIQPSGKLGFATGEE